MVFLITVYVYWLGTSLLSLHIFQKIGVIIFAIRAQNCSTYLRPKLRNVHAACCTKSFYW